jgi:hypothetical protein
MGSDPRKAFAALSEGSVLLKAVAELKNARGPGRLFKGAVRSLSPKEIEALETHGNTCADWSKVKAADGFKAEYIRNSSFSGLCALGAFSGSPRELSPGVSHPSGIYASTIVDSEIGSDCLVKDCGLLANYAVKEGAVVFGVGSISTSPGCVFGNGMKIPVGMETGGREVVACAELDAALAARLALERGDRELQEKYGQLAAGYREGATCSFGIAEAGSVIRNTREIRNAYIGEGARIDGAALVENCTILSSLEERTEVSHGAVVRNSCLQWGCEATTMAIVADSLLTEYSRVERHGKVTASIVGPNTDIAEGEVTSCLIGPFVGFHHQALLIAALWPEGKGNVAYGANVGSNHTSRAPDQEIFCGEGMFFGLGINIKFPSDFSSAPYSIIATGVTTLPQKVQFPFSLISSPARNFTDISPAFNEIVPAWVLSDNIYMVRRNEGKYRARNSARRASLDFTVFRPEIVDGMASARDRLRDVREKKEVYTDRDIRGLGKNYMTEENRLHGMETYGFYIEYYCLSGLKDRIEELNKKDKGGIPSVLDAKTADPLWEHARALISKEGFGKKGLKACLLRLIEIREKIEEDTLQAKAKDDERGARIIPGYEEVYPKAAQDPFIQSTREETAEAVARLRAIISSLAV